MDYYNVIKAKSVDEDLEKIANHNENCDSGLVC